MSGTTIAVKSGREAFSFQDSPLVGKALMVAKAAWSKVEPEINLRTFLAGEETLFLSPSLDWMPNEWATAEEDFEVRCEGDASLEND